MKHFWIALVLGFWAGAGFAETAAKPEIIETGLASDLYMSDAIYYPANGTRAVVWVPGYIFNKESWGKMAKVLQKRDVASIAISGKVEKNIRQAIRELVRRGYQDIVLVGGSSGAAAVLNTMEQVTATDVVTGVVLLSPVRGNPMDDQPVRKLFIVSEEERSFATVNALYEGSMAPRELVAIPGSAHAQFLFFGADKEKVTDLIVEFIMD